MSLPEPNPFQRLADVPDPPRQYSAGDWLLFALGAVAGLGSIFLAGVGALVLLLIFLMNKPPRAPFVRGTGLGLAILGVLLLGGLGICLVGGVSGNDFVH